MVPADDPTSKINYRNMARQHADRARTLLNVLDEQSPIYAGLELRMALEALVYEVAQEFLEDLPADHAAWQPHRLLRRLLEIDPGADSAHELQVQLRAEGDAEGNWVSFGKESRLSLKTIGDHYGAIGSYLHAPTLASLHKGKPHDVNRLRQRGQALLSQIDDVLASTLWNLNIKSTSETRCSGCGSSIKRRLNRLEEGPRPRLSDVVIECFECLASYRVTRDGDGYRWAPIAFSIPCLHEGCGSQIQVWRRQVDYGNLVRCDACGNDVRFDLLATAGGSERPNRLPFTPPWTAA